MTPRANIALLLATLAVAACEEKPHKPPLPQTDKDAGAVLFQDQRKALDKARGVEQTVQQHEQEQRQAAEQSTR